MDVLTRIISDMNKEDIRYYKLYASRISSSKDRKDVRLFDYIRKSANKYHDKYIFKKLYGGGNKNAYYRLKNRLVEDLTCCLITQHYYKHSSLYIYHLLSVAGLYFSRNNFLLALRFIQKAEKEAQRIENYELLDIIYGEYIRLSHEIVSINPEQYILKRQQNRNQINTLRQMDDILAALTYRLKITQNFSDKENPLLEILQKTVDEFTNEKMVKKSPKLKFKIYAAVSQILIQRHDYLSLEKYLLSTYSQFVNEKIFVKENHDQKLEMLSHLVNALFKNKKYKESLRYAEEMKQAMEEYDRMLYDKYLFFYYNALVINYSVIDKDKAITILEGLRDNNVLKNTPFYEIFVYLNLSILWFDKEQFHNSIRCLNKLFLHENYKNAAPSLQFKIAIAELIIRYELGDFDFLEHRLHQTYKHYNNMLQKPEHETEKEFLNILKKMMFVTASGKESKKNLARQVIKFLRHRKQEEEDAEIINYKDWLTKKAKQYELLIE